MKSNFAPPAPFGRISGFVMGVYLSNYKFYLFLIYQTSYLKGYQWYLIRREVLGSIWKIGRYPISVRGPLQSDDKICEIYIRADPYYEGADIFYERTENQKAKVWILKSFQWAKFPGNDPFGSPYSNITTYLITIWWSSSMSNTKSLQKLHVFYFRRTVESEYMFQPFAYFITAVLVL